MTVLKYIYGGIAHVENDLAIIWWVWLDFHMPVPRISRIWDLCSLINDKSLFNKGEHWLLVTQ